VFLDALAHELGQRETLTIRRSLPARSIGVCNLEFNAPCGFSEPWTAYRARFLNFHSEPFALG
jgi:hypothetical protein